MWGANSWRTKERIKFKELYEFCGGDEGIRTLDILLGYTPLAGERLRPLGHVSVAGSARKGRLMQECSAFAKYLNF